MTNYETADRRRRDRLNVLSSKLFGNAFTKRFRLARMLQHQRALQVDRAVQAARQNKVAFQQRFRFSELLYYVFRLQALNPDAGGAVVLQSQPMPPFANLVSDSTLVQETIDLLRISGGRANASQIADAVFKVSHIDEELAGLLVGDLVKDDRRFKIIDGNTIELQAYDSESRLLAELDFVVVDIEATGAKMPPNRIIELGAYRIRGGQIVDNFITLVNPEISIPRFVVALTGISNEMVKQAPLFAEVAPKWLEFVEDAVLIAHNAPFDTNFLNHEISRVYPGHRMINPHLCTVTLSRRAVPGLANYRLETVADHFSISIVDRHRAGSDALATAEVFLRILARLEEHGVRDLATARSFESPLESDAAQTESGPEPELLPLVSGFQIFKPGAPGPSFQHISRYEENDNQNGQTKADPGIVLL